MLNINNFSILFHGVNRQFILKTKQIETISVQCFLCIEEEYSMRKFLKTKSRIDICLQTGKKRKIKTIRKFIQNYVFFMNQLTFKAFRQSFKLQQKAYIKTLKLKYKSQK